jgi:hypothetical protein
MAEVTGIYLRLPLSYLLAAALALCGCFAQPDRNGIELRAAIERAQVAAIAAGYDLAAFDCDGVARGRVTPNDRWVIHYTCKQERPEPGCGFSVTMDARTGDTDIYGDE